MPDIDIDALHALIDVLQMQRNQIHDALAQVTTELVGARKEIEHLQKELTHGPANT